MLQEIIEPYPDTKIALWDLREDAAWFERVLVIPDAERQSLESTYPTKRHEWMASRYCLSLLTGEGESLYYKDIHGKPYRDTPPYHVSFSHTQGKAAAAVSGRALGIDVQLKVPKMLRVAPKFVGPHESTWCAENMTGYNEMVHLVWSAKEAVYKAYGLKELPFIDNIKLDKPEAGHMRAYVQKPNFAAQYELGYRDLGNWLLVWAVQTH